MRSLRTIQDVVDWGLCTGCGACYSICENSAIELIDVEHVGIRPKIDAGKCGQCNNCLYGCPGYCVTSGTNGAGGKNAVLIGPTLGVWEGYASDSQVRHRASSGGMLTALSLYCLEVAQMSFVLHTGMDSSQPWRNKTVVSRTREELMEHSGSRYAVSSPCDSLRLIEEADGPCVFIGKPCDTAAVEAIRKKRPKLDANLGLVLTFCCAGVPATLGSLDLINKLDLKKEQIAYLSYRGNGWPGGFRALDADNSEIGFMPYMQSWHFLQQYRSFRCQICPDGLGEVCDISCGDAWHRYRDQKKDPGISLVMARSAHGRKIINDALDAGYVSLQRSSSTKVIQAQGLVSRRMEIFGRQLAMKMMLVPTTCFIGFNLLYSWIRAPLIYKAKSISGTLKRIVQRKLWRRTRMFVD